MKLTLSLLLIMLFVGIGSGQNGKSVAQLERQIKTFKNSENYSVESDAKNDETSVSFLVSSEMISGGDYYASSMPNSSGNGGFSKKSYFTIGSGFGFKSDTLTKTPDVFFVSLSYSGYHFLFPSNPKLVVLLDGQSIELGEGRGFHQRSSGFDNRSYEYFSFTVSRENLQKIAAAKSLTLKIGKFVRKINSKDAKMFGDILNLSEVN